MKKQIFTLLCGGLSIAAFAQDSIPNQFLGEAQIVDQFHRFNVESEELDSTIMKSSRGQSLGQLLTAEGWGNLSVYGAPGLNIQARTAGLSADHTSVNWNGIPVESPTLGSTDLSLVPMFLVSHVSLSDGGAFNQGSSFGGSIHLNTQRRIQRNGAELFAEYSTLGNLLGGVKSHYRLGRFSGRTGIQYGQFNNDFEVLMNDAVTWQENNNVDQLAVSQDLQLEINERHGLYVSALWVDRQAQIPFQRNSFGLVAQDQADSTMKIAAGWKFNGNKILTEVKWGSAVERQNYTYSITWEDEVLDEISQIRTAKNLVDGSVVYYANKGLKFGGGVRAQDVRATTSNFSQNKNAQIGSAYLMAEWKNDVLDTRVNGRFDHNSHTNDGTAFDVVLFKTVSKESLSIRPEVVVSKKFRAPDFNELYWAPGGNVNLVSENGWSYSGGLILKVDKKANISISSKYTHMEIDNMIQWVPEGWVWTVQNFRAAKVDWVKSEIAIERGSYSLKLRHEFSENSFSNDDGTTGRTLYVPKHQFRAALQAHVADLNFNLSLLMRDRVTVQPDDVLSYRTEFSMLNFSVNWEFQVSSSTLDLTFGVDNVLDQQMEFIQYSPMPGRVFRFGLGWVINS